MLIKADFYDSDNFRENPLELRAFNNDKDMNISLSIKLS